MTLTLFETIKLTAKSFGLQVLITQAPFSNFSEFDFGLRRKLYADSPYQTILTQLIDALKPNTLLYFQDPFGFYYYAFAMPKESAAEPISYVFLGPFVYQTFSLKDFEEKVFPIDCFTQQELKHYLDSIPVVKELAPLQSLLCGLFSHLYPEEGFLFIPAVITEPITMYKKQKQMPPDTERDFEKKRIEKRYILTELLLKNIGEGNNAKAFNHFRTLLKEYDNLPVKIKHERYQLLSYELNVLLRSLAHNHKVHSLYCEDTYQNFFRQISDCTSFSHAEKTLYEMISEYGQLIKEHSRRNYSNLIRDCLDYIDFHYSESLTLESEAARLSVSASYLSSRFVKETGSNFITYVNTIRIRYARLLLKNLQLPIQRIAELCGFSSSNYFARVFHQQEGLTPTAFRNKMQQKT